MSDALNLLVGTWAMFGAIIPSAPPGAIEVVQASVVHMPCAGARCGWTSFDQCHRYAAQFAATAVQGGNTVIAECRRVGSAANM